MVELQTINQVSKEYGISTRMMRYYEQIGLIKSLRKEDYAYRVYDEIALRRLQQIIILRKLRIPMKHISIILSQPEAAEAVEIFKQNISDLDDEINALSTIKRILDRLVDELQTWSNFRLDINSLLDSSILSIVNLISLSKNHIKETEKMEGLSKANDKLSKINDNDVRIIYLPPAMVASALGIGDEAEHESDILMGRFIKDVDLLKTNPGVKFYGFNNPEFGQNGEFIQHRYEVWATIPDYLEIPTPLKKKSFAGGLYAAYTSKPVSFDDWKPFGSWLINNEDFEYDGSRSYRDDTTKEHKVTCSGWGCLEDHFNSYNIYGLKNRKHILSHIDFLIPIKEKVW